MATSKVGYWSGETLLKRLPTLIKPASAFHADRIDCGSYRLSIGHQIYVSPSKATSDPQNVTVRELKDEEAFTVPAGQFALLVTAEIIEVPNDAIAFISIRAKTKFKGLVNISGFHVDPGYKGQLTFSVFNAGPLPIHLQQGQQIFVLWYAYLDSPTKYLKAEPAREGLDVELIQGISGELESFASLSERLRSLDQDLRDRVHAVEKEQQFYRAVLVWAVPLLVAATVAVTSWFMRDPNPKDGAVQAVITSGPAVDANASVNDTSQFGGRTKQPTNNAAGKSGS